MVDDLTPICPSPPHPQETPLTPRTPRRTLAVPKLQINSESGDKAPSPAPTEASQSEAGEPALLLPPSVSGLAPLVLAAGLKPPPPPPPNKFQQLKRTVAQRLGSLDPAWLRRCQGTPGDEGTMPDAAQEGEHREIGWAPSEEEGGGGGPSVGDSGRKRPRGDGGGGDGDGGGGDGTAAPAKLRRCRRDSAEAAFGTAGGLKQSKEEEEVEEEHVAAQKESGKVSDPSENLLGEFEEEEEKPKPTRRAVAAR